MWLFATARGARALSLLHAARNPGAECRDDLHLAPMGMLSLFSVLEKPLSRFWLPVSIASKCGHSGRVTAVRLLAGRATFGAAFGIGASASEIP
jgi:hypothetical protein